MRLPNAYKDSAGVAGMGARYERNDDHRLVRVGYTSTSSMAIPIPPPMQVEAIPRRRFLRFIPVAKLTTIIGQSQCAK